MRYSLGALVFLIPLALLPGWSFYYDVTPKAVLLMAGVALLLAWSGFQPLNLETSRVRRWNGWLALGFMLTAGLAAAFSAVGAEAWIGSDWRRMGAIPLAAAVVAGWFASTSWIDRGWVVRGVCGAGLIAGGYAIAQYAGWDPWLDAGAYHFGDGLYRIVRPPATMGHSNYLAAFLLWPVFLGFGLWRSGRSWYGLATTVVAATALALCGSRGAWLGLAAGAAIWIWRDRPKWRVAATAVGLLLLAGGLFYASPAGEALRARMFWISEDATGGSRLLLWRDTLAMSFARPLIGFGPDAFSAEFPLFQSAELSRLYPDFYHESPHNLFLDALVNQGLPAMLLLCAWIGLAILTASRVRDRLSLPLLSGLIATLVAHQFAVLILPTAFVLFGMLGLIARLEAPDQSWRVPRWARIAPLAAGIVLGAFSVWFAAADARLAAARRLLDAHLPAQAADLWRMGGPVRADLYFSQRWAAESARSQEALDKLRFAQLAGETAVAATRRAEQRQNAWYSLAILQASANDARAVDQSLRAAIESAPTWYKPHWMLARLLWTTGHRDQALSEAEVALQLNGGHDSEVAQSLEEIVRSGIARR